MIVRDIIFVKNVKFSALYQRFLNFLVSRTHLIDKQAPIIKLLRDIFLLRVYITYKTISTKNNESPISLR